MSNINIQRAVENIRYQTNTYTPLVEVIVNAIEAIDEAANTAGAIQIGIKRSPQRKVDGAQSEITGFTVTDNGIGFTKRHRDSFDTLYTTEKLEKGGKGFGRFVCLKYFASIKIKSVFRDEDSFMQRVFSMGRETEIIVNETLERCEAEETGTVVELSSIRAVFPDQSLEAVSRSLVEKLLPFFADENRRLPEITVFEADGDKKIKLNEYLGDPLISKIQEVSKARGDFDLVATSGKKTFYIRVFKLYSPKNQRSKISLVAHNREVTTTSLHNFIPEFQEEFYDRGHHNKGEPDRNFIVAVYVYGDYLDEHVAVERGGFEFRQDQDLLLGISQRDIEREAAQFGNSAVDQDVNERRERKKNKVQAYVRNEAPWYSHVLDNLNYDEIPFKPTDEQLESKLHEQAYREELDAKKDVRQLLETDELEEMHSNVSKVVERVSGSSKNELIHYVALRRSILELFGKSLELNSEGNYSSEGLVHNIIFPTKSDSDSVPFERHNLWIVDERLNFAEYLASDKPLSGPKSDRPDLMIYDKRIGFRGDNESSNPVTIFEFKRPQREDFANASSKEDPVDQIVRYVIQIREGKFRTPQGRDIKIQDNTPFYGYVVCDLTKKVRMWLESVKDFKPMPDREGYFKWHENLNLYCEVLGWNKVLKDASMRNRIFFHKLGIE